MGPGSTVSVVWAPDLLHDGLPSLPAAKSLVALTTLPDKEDAVVLLIKADPGAKSTMGFPCFIVVPTCKKRRLCLFFLNTANLFG